MNGQVDNVRKTAAEYCQCLLDLLIEYKDLLDATPLVVELLTSLPLDLRGELLKHRPIVQRIIAGDVFNLQLSMQNLE